MAPVFGAGMPLCLSPRASSTLVYRFVAVLRREVLNLIFEWGCSSVVAEISFPPAAVSIFVMVSLLFTEVPQNSHTLPLWHALTYLS